MGGEEGGLDLFKFGISQEGMAPPNPASACSVLQLISATKWVILEVLLIVSMVCLLRAWGKKTQWFI